jgi:thioredoxin reductase (NADPH)
VRGLTLAQHASRVIVLHRGTAFSAQDAYVQRVKENPRIEVRFGTVVEEALGNGGLNSVRTRTVGNGKIDNFELAGLFVYVGLAPATSLLDGVLALDASGRVPIDGEMRSSLSGLFAAGTSDRFGWPGSGRRRRRLLRVADRCRETARGMRISLAPSRDNDVCLSE